MSAYNRLFNIIIEEASTKNHELDEGFGDVVRKVVGGVKRGIRRGAARFKAWNEAPTKDIDWVETTGGTRSKENIAARKAGLTMRAYRQQQRTGVKVPKTFTTTRFGNK